MLVIHDVRDIYFNRPFARGWVLSSRQPLGQEVILPDAFTGRSPQEKRDGDQDLKGDMQCNGIDVLLTMVRYLLFAGFRTTANLESVLIREAHHDFGAGHANVDQRVKGQLLGHLFPYLRTKDEFEYAELTLDRLLETEQVMGLFEDKAFLLFEEEAYKKTAKGWSMQIIPPRDNWRASVAVYDGKSSLEDFMVEFLSRGISGFKCITAFPQFLVIRYRTDINTPHRWFEELSRLTLRGDARTNVDGTSTGPLPKGAPTRQEREYSLIMVVGQDKKFPDAEVRLYDQHCQPVIPEHPQRDYIRNAWRLGHKTHEFILFYFQLSGEAPRADSVEMLDMEKSDMEEAARRKKHAFEELDTSGAVELDIQETPIDEGGSQSGQETLIGNGEEQGAGDGRT